MVANELMNTTYQPVTPALAEELGAIVGAANVLYGDPVLMADYGHDETAGLERTFLPEVVVKPDSASQVAGIMLLANREHIPVTPRGAGSGLSGGAVPVHGGILLSLERMNRILEIDLANLVAVVEPGVVTNDIGEAVRPHGLFYAGYPMSVEMCFIGGNVAENAGGGRAVKYGVTGNHVLGLQVVLPTGDIIELGGKRVKDVSGYDLLHLMVGSEGTLGVFTRITLRLLPLPPAVAVLLVPFADVKAAMKAVPHAVARGQILPSAVEMMDSFSVRLAYEFIGEKPPHPEIGAMLLIEVDGYDRAGVEAQMNTLADLCLEAGALDVYVGNTPALIKKMWRPRQKVAEAFYAAYPEQLGEDIVVPMAQIPALLAEVEQLSGRYQVRMPCFGHAADGNLHLHIMKEPEMSQDLWRARKPAVLADLYRLVAGFGGAISGEHGIGMKRAPYLPLVMDPVQIALQRRIKQAFDPLYILNPGKIFPDQLDDRDPGAINAPDGNFAPGPNW